MRIRTHGYHLIRDVGTNPKRYGFNCRNDFILLYVTNWSKFFVQNTISAIIRIFQTDYISPALYWQILNCTNNDGEYIILLIFYRSPI